jgi:DNA anti-recombination protein RmuC
MGKMAKEKEKQSAKTSDSSSGNSSSLEGTDLDQLRHILFGNQSRAIEERLDELEMRLETVRREARDELKKEAAASRQTNEQNRADLSQRIDKEAGILADTRKELQALQRSIAEEMGQMKRELLEALSEQSNSLKNDFDGVREDLIERLLAKQIESRQRDDALRRELLALSAWLDNSKTSRMQLGEMLMHVGQQLQENGENGPKPEIAASETNDESA